MRPYDCKGNVSDRNARAWRVSMHGHGGSACASMSYNVKRKNCNRDREQMCQDNTSRVHRQNQSSPQRVLRHEDCLDFSCLELIVIEVERGTVCFCHGVKFFVETRLAEGHCGFWVRTRLVKVPCMPTVVT